MNKKRIIEIANKVNEIQKQRYNIIKSYQDKLNDLRKEYSNDLSYQIVYNELDEEDKKYFKNVDNFIEIIFEEILMTEGIK